MLPFVLRLGCPDVGLGVWEIRVLADMVGLPDVAIDSWGPFVCLSGIESDVCRLVSRSVLVKDGYREYCRAASRQELVSLVQTLNDMGTFDSFGSLAFRFQIDCFGRKLSCEEKCDLIHDYSFLPLNGKVDLCYPAVIFGILILADGSGEKWWFCRHVQRGSRSLITKYSLKSRVYLGTTSMDAELSLVMCNLAQIGPGSLVYDPFVGTGSLLVTSAELGAFSLGSDIDVRQLGNRDGSIQDNVQQYDLESRVLDTLVLDVSCCPWRQFPLFDAIITDPPYGIRAGARRLGNGSLHQPQTVPYPIEQIVGDLVHLASRCLVPQGRLVYWHPSSRGDEPNIPMIPAMKLIGKHEQKLALGSRWLVVMEKRPGLF